jgi:uncharacterized protein (AIM24 family)
MSTGRVPSILRRQPAFGQRPPEPVGVAALAPAAARLSQAGPAAGRPIATTPPVQPPRTAAPRQAHEIDFQIHGSEMQFVELELDHGESAIAEAGAMMFKPPAVTMDTIFGDGSQPDQGFFGKLASAGKRIVTGESLFMTQFTNEGHDKTRVAFAAPYPGTILPFNLAESGGTLIAQKDSFLCAAKGVSVGIFFQKRIGAGLFGGNGFIMQKLEGDGWAFVHGGGVIVERDLAPGELLHVDTGCVVAMTPSIGFDIVRAGSVKSMLFGGEGFFFAELSGPGRVWLQSLPFSRLAGRINALGGVGRAGGGGSSLSSAGSWSWGSGDGGGDGGGD